MCLGFTLQQLFTISQKCSAQSLKDLYNASFHIAVEWDDLDKIKDANGWPTGSLFRQFRIVEEKRIGRMTSVRFSIRTCVVQGLKKAIFFSSEALSRTYTIYA